MSAPNGAEKSDAFNKSSPVASAADWNALLNSQRRDRTVACLGRVYDTQLRAEFGDRGDGVRAEVMALALRMLDRTGASPHPAPALPRRALAILCLNLAAKWHGVCGFRPWVAATMCSDFSGLDPEALLEAECFILRATGLRLG